MKPTDTTPTNTDRSKDGRRTTFKSILLLVFLGLAIFGYLRFGEDLTLENLANRESALRDYRNRSPILDRKSVV